ncbi:hypothetical protein NDU88_005703 [Pleurodeles waltl]|uniref:Uncharacterized protein n=1 Tax=Pleurodeles waltl TaxID=8319 RepID=A0AAV7W8S7_PLEWA|nr:hypothetical protein NDU88_005703 [Pleurodeles waltl]
MGNPDLKGLVHGLRLFHGRFSSFHPINQFVMVRSRLHQAASGVPSPLSFHLTGRAPPHVYSGQGAGLGRATPPPPRQPRSGGRSMLLRAILAVSRSLVGQMRVLAAGSSSPSAALRANSQCSRQGRAAPLRSANAPVSPMGPPAASPPRASKK